MNFRYMRIMVMFDLPVIKSEEKREYRKFKRFLEKQGYIMIQESVYSKLALNGSIVKVLENALIKHKPKYGFVLYFTLTENQYSSMKFLVGDLTTDIVDSEDRYLEL